MLAAAVEMPSYHAVILADDDAVHEPTMAVHQVKTLLACKMLSSLLACHSLEHNGSSAHLSCYTSDCHVLRAVAVLWIAAGVSLLLSSEHPPSAFLRAARCYRTHPMQQLECMARSASTRARAAAFAHLMVCNRNAVAHCRLHVSRQASKGIADKVATLLRFWEGKYRYLWEQDKDAYMRHAR